MKLTIDNLNGAGETDYSAQLDAGAPPKIVRKLNQPPVLTAWLVCQGTRHSGSAGSKVRLYRDSGGLWFSGYLEDAPQLEFAGEAKGEPVFRAALNAKGEISALDRRALSEHAAMGGYTAGEAVTALTREENAAYQCLRRAGRGRGRKHDGGDRRTLERGRRCSRQRRARRADGVRIAP